ncbi:MAG: substrate-binding domain-containing protein, partial [Catalinimonas sp.]
VVKAYGELRARGLIEARHGKGYYVRRTEIFEHYVGLVFNKLSAHKRTVYDAIVQTLGDEAHVDLHVYNNDFGAFRKLIEEHAADYTHLIVISHFYSQHSPTEVLKQVPPEKLVVLDRLPDDLPDDYAAVYQNFGEDIFQALHKALDDLRRYDRLTLAYPPTSHHSPDIAKGFRRFCEQHGLNHRVDRAFTYADDGQRDAYVLLEEGDLVALLRTAKQHHLMLGQDIGVITYNESPLKEFIAGGLTVISTDFAAMGTRAAELVLSGHAETPAPRVENAFQLIRRASL